MSSRVAELFEDRGWDVEPFGRFGYSYIADNGTYCIPFTKSSQGTYYPEISAVTFKSRDREAIKKYYAGDRYIGKTVYSDYVNGCLKFIPVRGILLCGGHLTLWDVEQRI